MTYKSHCQLMGLRGKPYYAALRKFLDQHGQQMSYDARSMKPLSPISIGELSVKYELNFKATCEWLEESGVIPTGIYSKLMERGAKVSDIIKAVREKGMTQKHEEVAQAHRVFNIGSYNRYVSSCGICDSSERIEILGKHCLGFGTPDRPASFLDKSLAVVYECPDCFERQWSHGTLEGDYYTYLRYLHRNKRHKND